MNPNWLVTAFFFALLALILYTAFLILTPFLTAIIWAAILAILVHPFYAWLLRRLRGRATLAAIVVVVLITLLVITPGFEIAWFLSDDAAALVKSVGALLDDDGQKEWLAQPWVQKLLGWWSMVSFQLMNFKIDWKEVLVQGVQVSSGVLVGQVKGIAQNVLMFAVNFVVVLFTLFFMLRDGAGFLRKIQHLLPMDREHQQRLLNNIVDAVLAVVQGSLVVAMVQGLLAGSAYWVVGVPFSVLWGVITGFFALLPIGGSAIVSVPVSIYLFLQGETLRGVGLLIWCLGIVGMVDNILKPLLIGNRLGLPVLFLFFGILGGLALFGALGIILGPALFALLRVLLDLYAEEYQTTEPQKENP